MQFTNDSDSELDIELSTPQKSHVLDHIVAELRTFDFGRAIHQTREIVRDALACDRAI